jgi:hypothetical protein
VTKSDAQFWIEAALFGATAVLLLICYRPPKRRSVVTGLTFRQKLGKLDIPGTFLVRIDEPRCLAWILIGRAQLTAALTLLLVGMGLGDNPYAWDSAQVVVPLVLGSVTLVAFGLYGAS